MNEPRPGYRRVFIEWRRRARDPTPYIDLPIPRGPLDEPGVDADEIDAHAEQCGAEPIDEHDPPDPTRKEPPS